LPLTDTQIERYARQLLLSQVGGKGQERLLAATVRVEGTGSGADEAATYLAAAGVGRLRLDTEFPSTRRRFLAKLNPDVQFDEAGPSDLCLKCDAESDRLFGAQQALKALMRLSGASPDMTWSGEGVGGRRSC
jgi:hypothetical protein